MKEVLFKILDKFSEGVDTYHDNGSMWFIFTDDKKWVIELTKDGTLWYNFYFFQDCFKYLSLDVVENQHYITEWVEDTIQNGVRSTFAFGDLRILTVEDTIQNGVRSTQGEGLEKFIAVEDTIQNGVKYTTQYGCDDTTFVESVIQNGIKYIKKRNRQPYGKVENIVKNGIKEVIELPDKSGELNGYGEYYARQKNMTYPHTDIVNDVITDGIKQTNLRKVDNHPTYLDHILIEK